ncbi:alpha/beta hydrolase [Chryseosolibacter indicus]|uniref:Alpha/beta hydrolase n=1 Tax=Chryseosolibacter indicus TaxID=2782351 RepID=A0ABS5VRE5_9BACT|nr:alpha/beta hydrolase [Chryseosolibacter indicus]MBT1703998.1 alpha/beta hydrolase [Chryseosolibacter indicus]
MLFKRFKVMVLLIVLAGLYFIGPAPSRPRYNVTYPEVPSKPQDLENYIIRKEGLHKIKPDNEARIIWADSNKLKTEYAVIYLHGFSASQKEGDPVHKRFAKDFGCNLFLSRLADHGIDTTEALLNYTAERAWNSAKEALAIGNAIGKKVIIISTSTGGTLALMLAAQYPDKVHALINLSPNIAINNPAAFLLNDPWGLYIARMVMDGKYRVSQTDSIKSKYWDAKYRLEAAVQLEELLSTSMNKETFNKVKQPVLTLYYYKNEQEQDPEVKVSAMLEMHEQLGTPSELKIAKPIPSAEAHVIGGALSSKDVESVYQEMREFAIQTLQMPVKN